MVKGKSTKSTKSSKSTKNTKNKLQPYEIGELDQYLFGQGNHYEIYQKMGAHKVTHKGKEGVYFAVWAPKLVFYMKINIHLMILKKMLLIFMTHFMDLKWIKV